MGKQWKQWQTLLFGAPKSLQMVTATKKLKDACSFEESYDKPRQCIKKQRHHLAAKGLYSQSYGFSSSHVRESWSIRKAERRWTDAFELWWWWVPWTARRSNQSILKEINHEYSLEGLLLKLKLQYFRHRCQEPMHWKRPWCWERLKAKGEEGSRW